MADERHWISVNDFAEYLGVSRVTVYKLAKNDPDVMRVTKRLGRRVLICLWSWKQGEEHRMAGSTA